MPILDPGTLIGNRYQVMSCVGQGGLGVVYGAQDARLHRPVAVKFVRDEHQGDTRIEKQFFDEAIHTSQVNHPNIVTIHDYGHFDKLPYIVMEFLEGCTLDQLILAKSLDERAFVSISCQLLDALDTAHRMNLIHGDIQPRNLMVHHSVTTNRFWIKVFDFGLCRILRTDLKQAVDEDHTVVGSIHYMAPEQFKGGEIDGRTDLYAVGVLFYEMLCGELPYESDNTHEWIEKVVFGQPVPLRTRNPNVSEDLEKLVMALMAKDPAERFQTAGAARASFLE